MFHSLKASPFKDQGRARPNKPPSPQYIACAYAKVSGGYIGGVPPVPIPNTEVKPSRADGTARFACGRVGRCRNFSPRRPAAHSEPRGVAFPAENLRLQDQRGDAESAEVCVWKKHISATS